MGKLRETGRVVSRVLLPEGREVEFSLDHGPLQEQVANLCETHGIDYDEDENLKVLVMECPFGSSTVEVVLGHLSDLEILPRRSPFHLLDGLQLAERQLQDLDDAMGGGAPANVSAALQVLLQSIHQNEIFAQEVVMQRREDKHEIIMLDSGLPSRELLLGREAEEMLASITGQAEFKQMIRDGAMLEHQNRLRSQAGTDTQRHRPGHVLLKGKPGTGKTTAARIYASILYHLGLIESNRLVEVQRGDLVGQYIGHTEHKTKCKIHEARGGVLFVDEAYQLVEDRDFGARDFGKKALEEIMSVMERGDPVIVFAGYPDRMETFLAANEGLKRRIQHTFTFQDLSTRELAQIFLRKATGKKWRLREVTEEDVDLLFKKKTTPQSRSEHNGGLADRLLARSSEEQARRLEESRTRAEVISRQMEQTLELEDIKAAMERLLQ